MKKEATKAEAFSTQKGAQDEALRVKVAELCGWIKAAHPQITSSVQYWVKDDVYHEAQYLPDYHNDLNACAEFEKALPVQLRDDYTVSLSIICDQEHRMAPVGWLMLTATALQRCHAFVKTMEGRL